MTVEQLPARSRAAKINRSLAKLYPDARCMLDFSNPLELLVATILAAQCTDKKVNEVTTSLFRRYRSAEDYAKAEQAELEKQIRPTGFFRQKARSIVTTCRELAERHGGQVPETIEDLTALSGVGRKTANVVVGAAFGQPAIIVDTHVRRLAGRLGLSGHTDPDKIEADLRTLLPRKQWTDFSHRLAFHGRQVCFARKPVCPKCAIAQWCPSAQL
ncbi:MAG: endonuclease III [Acidithiobacillales bacterium SM23_46]|nr:MAG: endonuclease III [Acidithiobacillales bacterium SM23_46]